MEQSTRYIISKVQIFQWLVVHILKKHGYLKLKPMWKPNLTFAIKEASLTFVVKYKDWTIKNWKRVI